MQQPIDINAPWQVTDPEIMEIAQYLSGANGPDIEEDVRLCIASGARAMILDCSKLTYATSAGLRAFVAIARMMDEVGGIVSIKGLRGQPREIFDACGIGSLVPLNEAALELPRVQVA